jgi:hypothetical protein
MITAQISPGAEVCLDLHALWDLEEPTLLPMSLWFKVIRSGRTIPCAQP